MTKQNILVGQSGGPTAVINASLYGVITQGLRHRAEIGTIYGMVHGIEGFLAGNYLNLSEELCADDLALLKITPAAYLGSCRFKLPEDFSSSVYATLFKKFEELHIGAFFYIGGNDSMDTVSKLSQYAAAHGKPIRFIGIPKTIDNDLILTDHTPGFASAAKYVAATVREITMDSCVYHNHSVTIIELMGRHAGWLTASSILARKHADDNPVLIYLPEVSFSLEQFSRDIQRVFETHRAAVVCVSEGIHDADGTFICEYASSAQVDTFGHKMLTGCGKFLENYVREKFQIKVRSVELNVSQRCSSMLVSKTDIEEAALAGSFGVQAALSGNTGCMVAFERDSSQPYQMHCVLHDVSKICNQEKKFPKEWICENGTDVSEAFLEYVTPLIQGEVEHVMEHGVPKFLYRKNDSSMNENLSVS